MTILRSRALRAIVAFAVSAALHGCGSTSPVVSSYAAELTGARVEPTATGSEASGTAALRDSAGGIAYEVVTSSFGTPITVVHLHLGAPDEIGPIVASLPVRAAAGRISAGRIDLAGYVTYNTLTVAGDSVRARLRNGTLYVDVHTAAFPGGELRGAVLAR